MGTHSNLQKVKKYTDSDSGREDRKWGSKLNEYKEE